MGRSPKWSLCFFPCKLQCETREPQLQSFQLPTSKEHNRQYFYNYQDQQKPEHKLILLWIFTLGIFLLPYTLITTWLEKQKQRLMDLVR